MSKTPVQDGPHPPIGRYPADGNEALSKRDTPALTRRGFVSSASLATMGVALGASIPFGAHMPAGLIPVALADGTAPFRIPGKDPGLTVLNDRPINAETPAHLLDDDLTPAARLFVRNNGIPPVKPNAQKWVLEIAGEAAEKKVTLSLADLKTKFKQYTSQSVLECAGNGRKEFFPPAKGNQWSTGAVYRCHRVRQVDGDPPGRSAQILRR